MKRKMKVICALLSLCMFIGILPIGTFAASTLADDDGLLIHYDFEGATNDEKLSDKAGTVNTRLYGVMEGYTVEKDGSVPETVIKDATFNFVFRDGTVRAAAYKRGALATGVTDDTKVIQQKPSEGTWYFRVKLPDGYGSTVFNFRKSPSGFRPAYLYYDGNSAISGATNENYKKFQVILNSRSRISATMDFSTDEWVNIALVRVWNADSNQFESTLKYRADHSSTWSRIWSGAFETIAPSDDVILSLFAECCNGQTGTNSVGYASPNMEYDDVRYYTRALDDAKLSEIVGELRTTVPDGSMSGDLGSTPVYPELEKHLLIHYDFQGSTLTEQLQDKAGSVGTDLFAVKDSYDNRMDDTAAGEYFEGTDGVLGALKTAQVSLVSESTADTLAMQSGAGTLFLRVKVPDAKAWRVLLNFRKTNVTAYGNNRPFHIDLDANNNLGFTVNNSAGVKTGEPIRYDEERWAEIALVRTYTGERYQFALKTRLGDEWVILATAQTYSLASADGVLISLFSECTMYPSIGNTCAGMAYDDVRYYDKALTDDELNSIFNSGRAVTARGVQRSTDTVGENGTYKVRLVAEIEGDAWQAAGFRVKLSADGIEGKTAIMPVTQAYTSLLAQTDGGISQVVRATEHSYLIAVVIEGIPVNGYDRIALTFTPYASDAYGTVDGRTAIVTMEAGRITSAVWADEGFGNSTTRYETDISIDALAEARADQALCDALIKRMRDSAVLCLGKSSVLWNGKIQKLDQNDYTAVATQAGTGVTVPADFVNRYFGEGTATGPVDIKALAESRGYEVLIENGLVILTPSSVASFADNALASGGYTNLVYKNRMLAFFNNSAMPEPENNTEQSRVVIEDATNYYPVYADDYTEPVYTNYYSPSVLRVEREGKSILYASNERCLTQNGNELSTTTVIWRSDDGGESWSLITELAGVRWMSLFEMNSKVYLVADRDDGTILGELIDDSYVKTKLLWGERSAITNPALIDGILYLPLDCMVLSCPANKDIFTLSNWTRTGDPSALITRDWYLEQTGNALNPGIGGTADILEGNVVKGKDGEIYGIWRIETQPNGNMAVMLRLSSDRTTLEMLPDTQSLITFPTTVSRFVIHYDAETQLYIAISNWWTVGEMCRARNVLGISVSSDLISWRQVDTLLVDREMMNSTLSGYAHAFQYADWDFDGDDLVLTVRETTEFSNTFHDGKYYTFYRVENFRDLIR